MAGRGSPPRSSLPFAVSGRASIQTNADGIMKAGNTPASWARSVEAASAGSLRHDVGNQAHAVAVIARDHGASADAGMRGQGVFNFAELDSKAAYLDLTVRPADEFENAGVEPADQVAGAIQPFALREWVWNELLRTQFRLSQIAAGKPAAANIELPFLSRRHRSPGGIQHVDVGIGDRTADRHGGRVKRQVAWNRVGRRERRAFRRPIAIDDLGVRKCRIGAVYVSDGQCLAADQKLTQTVKMSRILIHDRIEKSGGEPRGIDPVPCDESGQGSAGRHRIGADDHAAAIQQRPP